jgi:hypothetical protein
MGLEKDAIDKIVELNEKGNLLKDSTGREWTAKQVLPVIFNPMAAAITVHSLDGFTGYVNKELSKDSLRFNKNVAIFPEKVSECGFYAHVNGYDSVSLRSNVIGDDRKREVLANTDLDDALESFPFGRYLDQNEFVIKLYSLFQDTEDLRYLMRYVSSVTSDANVKTEDDGITQVTTVKRGVSGALSGQEDTKPVVELKPYRTFREIEQPLSKFLFRVQEGPEFALFEAGGEKHRRIPERQNRRQRLRCPVVSKKSVTVFRPGRETGS